MDPNDAGHEADSLIAKSGLKHPDSSLLQTFLKDAVDEELAASYLLQKCSNSTVQQFLEDWKSLLSFFTEPDEKRHDLLKEVVKRDGNSCCISRVRGSFWDPLIVSPIIPLSVLRIKQDNSQYELLGAFLTASERDRLFSLEESKGLDSVQNHWLLSRPALEAFQQGEIQIETRHTSKSKPQTFRLNYDAILPESRLWDLLERNDIQHVKLDDRLNSGIDVPNPYLLRIHSHFASALKWARITTMLASKSKCPPRTSMRPIKKYQFFKNALHSTWLKMPQALRLQVYKFLKYCGTRMYPPSNDIGVQKLPFNMYMKFSTHGSMRRHKGEFRSLEIIREQTSIPVPRPIDLIQTETDSYLITSRIPGYIVGWCIDLCTDSEVDLMVEDLRDYVRQMRAIQNPFADKYAICGSMGGDCLDWRLGQDPKGPFKTEAEFSDSLRYGIAPDLVHRSDHKIVFTHGDINMRNVMMKDGRITGIIDWETAGWYPEYWDYTKCHFTTRIHKHWLTIVSRVFGDYPEELKIEKEYQNIAPPF